MRDEAAGEHGTRAVLPLGCPFSQLSATVARAGPCGCLLGGVSW